MIEWESAYAVHKATVGLLTLIVAWEKSGYMVSVNGRNTVNLKQPIENLDDAKQAAINLARKYVAQMAEQLEIKVVE